jgi:hypothetical protein
MNILIKLMSIVSLVIAPTTDGVIESAENVSIKIEAGKLLINGTAVTDDVYKKYEKFYMSMSEKGIEIKASEIRK